MERYIVTQHHEGSIIRLRSNMPNNKPVSLYDCQNARYPDDVKTFDYLYCSKGYQLGTGRIRKERLGKPLTCTVCQECPDFVQQDDSYVWGGMK